MIEALKRGIRDRLVVELEYLTKGRLEVATRRVEPYLLFRGRRPGIWRPTVFSPAAQRTFKLERIRSARLTGDSYIPRSEMDLTSGRSGQAFIPGDVATWSTVRFEPRWLRHLEDRGVDFITLADGTAGGAHPLRRRGLDGLRRPPFSG